MIGSHNTYTYLNSDSKILNRNTRFWRCQSGNITKQYLLGVRYFDIRVFRTMGSFGKMVWRAAHGAAELEKSWLKVKAICNMFKATYKGAKFRLWLEKGSDEDIELFKKEVLECQPTCPQLTWAQIKLTGEVVYKQENHPEWHEYSYEKWDFNSIMNNLTNYPIKENALKNNPKITQEMIDDPNTVWLIDYACDTLERDGYYIE